MRVQSVVVIVVKRVPQIRLILKLHFTLIVSVADVRVMSKENTHQTSTCEVVLTFPYMVTAT